MLKALTIVYQEGLAAGTHYSTMLRLLAALRILLFPHGVLQFHSMEILKKLYNPARTHDHLYFLAHNYYISRRFTLWQRVQSAITHHQFELKNYNSEYARQVYRSSGVPPNVRASWSVHDPSAIFASSNSKRSIARAARRIRMRWPKLGSPPVWAISSASAALRNRPSRERPAARRERPREQGVRNANNTRRAPHQPFMLVPD